MKRSAGDLASSIKRRTLLGVVSGRAKLIRKIELLDYKRPIHLAVLLILTLSMLLPIWQEHYTHKRYDIDPAARGLIGTTNKNLTPKISYDAKQKIYHFNADAAVDQETNPVLKLQSKVGGEGKESKQLYSADIAEDLSQGVKFYDANTQVSISMIPDFKALPGKNVDGQLVYPLDENSSQLFYTLKNNGLKEDIVIPVPGSDTAEFGYQLVLPDYLEARKLPDGSIGIYSADPTLFGNLQISTDKDREKIDAARKNGEKNYLVFGLPAPLIKESPASDTHAGGQASFVLGERRAVEMDKQKLPAGAPDMGKVSYSLSVRANGLKQLNYPVSIDPSVVVTSTSDFAAGNNEGNIDFPANQISRGGLTGGTVGSWSSASSIITGRAGHTTVVYNGYMYVMGGCTVNLGCASYLNDVQYAPINSNGTLGSWHYTHNSTDDGTTFVAGFSNGRYFHSSVAYNGYLYVTGGYNGSLLNDVQYAPINSDGTVGSWTSTTAFTTARGGHLSVAYNGYMYIMGGCTAGTCTSFLNTVQYAPVNSDGTVGSWSATTSFSTAREAYSGGVYNGYMYIAGGYDAVAGVKNDVQYAPINGNGSLGSWSTTNSFTTARNGQSGTFYNGYMYVTGGWTSSTMTNDIQYAKIDVPGGENGFGTTTGFTTARFFQGSVAYNGYLYISGGSNGTVQSDVQYAAINNDGTVGSWSTTTSMPAIRDAHGMVAYNGYMYVLGGLVGGAVSNDVRYAAINSNGTLGAWSTTNNFTTARYALNAVAYNGYMYVLGGCTAGFCTGLLNDVQYAAINSNGSLGTWSSTTSFTGGRFFGAAEAYNGYMYVFGGATGTFPSDVQYAAINSNGTVGSWNTTSSFTTGRFALGSAVSKGYLYLFAGSDGTVYGDVQYAKINSDGTLGSWSTTTALPATRVYVSAAVHNGYLYVIGGQNSAAAAVNTVYYALLNNGGSGTANTFAAGTAASVDRRDHAAVAYNGYMYQIGGFQTGTGYLVGVQYSAIAKDGTLGSWSATSALPVTLAYHTAVAYNGYMYVLGGFNGTTYTATVLYAPINSNGTLGAWHYTHNSTDDGTTFVSGFTNARYIHTSVVNNGYIYVIGGYTGTAANDVQYAPLNSNGTVGSWTSTTSFTTARWAHASVVYNNYLYVLGGYSGSANLSDVQYAPINSNGTIGSWTFTAPFAFGRNTLGVSAFNGYIYIAAGTNGTAQNDVQYAPILTNGSLGVWGRTSSFTTARADAPTLIYNGFIYIVGGLIATGTTSSIQYASLNAIPRTGRYSKLVDMGSSQTIYSIGYNGSSTGKVDISYSLATSGAFGGVTTLENVRPGSTVNITPTTAHYVWVNLTIDDSTAGTFPDSDAGYTQITDITIYGPPGPTMDQVMRHGAWFSGGTEQPYAW